MKLNFRKGGAFASQKAVHFLKDKKPEDFRKITVIRHAAIGDLVVMRPVLIEMKKFFPNAKITLSIINTYSYGIPEDLVDEVHVIDKKDKNGKSTSFFQRLNQIKQLPPQDIIFDMADTNISFLLILFAKTHLKVGYTYRALKRSFYDMSALRSDFVLETESMMHQLNLFGANTQYFPYDYQLSNKKREEKNPYIIYFAGASIKSKCWDEENFVQLMKKMVEEYPEYSHVVLKGINNDEHFNDIYKPFKEKTNVIHQDALPLEKIYDYLAQASLLVSADTGIRNMAISTNTPTVGIMLALGAAPFRYYPRLDIHKVAYTLEYSQPDVNNVYSITRKQMIHLYN